MVQLSLYSPKGNQALRHFPFLGYLGLTPVHVEGVVRTSIDDGKLLPAKSITVSVRCYESRIGRLNVIHTNRLVDYTQVLWSKPDQDEWADIGDTEYPFRITLPTDVGGHSTANLQEYRVWWRVEAVLTHIPLGSVGSRQLKHYDLPFIRYDLPPWPSTPPSPPYLGSQTTKARAPTIRYHVSVPTTPVGPQDLVSVSLSLQPIEHSVSIRSASLIVERRIQFNEANPSSSTLSSTYPIPIASSRSHSQSHSAPSSYSNSIVTQLDDQSEIINETGIPSYSSPSVSPSPAASTVFTDHESARHLLPQPAPQSLPLSPFKTITHSVACAESSGRFACDDEGVWTTILTFPWPSAKSSTHWAMGETMQTDLASVNFFVRVKVIVSSPTGAESIELDEQELHVVSTNNTERELAQAKYNELLEGNNGAARSKSKSPRRIRRKREPLPDPPPVDVEVGLTMMPSNIALPPASQAEHSHLPHKSSTSSPYPTKSKKAPRRPHTSAGPRDNSNEFRREANLYERKRPDHRYSTNVMPSSDIVVDGSGGGVSALINSFVRKRTTTPRLCPSGCSSSSSLQGREHAAVDLHLPDAIADARPRAIQPETELSRIEIQNRRSSRDIFGYFRKKIILGDRDG